MLPRMSRRGWAGARTFALRYLIALVLAAALTAVGVVAVNRGINDRVGAIERVKLNVAPAPPQGANFLLIGSDSRAGETDPAAQAANGSAATVGGQRSDTLMVAHVEPGSKRTLVVSF